MSKIDDIDYKILSILLQDSRTKHSDISRAVGISKGRVGYRINKMIESGLILGYKLNVNTAKLDLTEYILLITFKESSKAKRTEAIEALKKHNTISWIGTTYGSYDLRVVMIIDNAKLKQEIDSIYKVLEQNVSECKVLLRTKKYPGHKHFISYAHQKAPRDIKKVNLDEKDWNIIKILAYNPKLTYREIGIKLGVTGEDIKYRFDKIMKSDVIKNFSIGIDYTKLGYIWWNVQFVVQNKSAEQHIIEYLQKHDHVSNIITTVGEFDMNCTWFSQNIAEANEFILSLREQFDTDIQHIEVIAINDSLKFPQVPEIIFEKK